MLGGGGHEAGFGPLATLLVLLDEFWFVFHWFCPNNKKARPGGHASLVSNPSSILLFSGYQFSREKWDIEIVPIFAVVV